MNVAEEKKETRNTIWLTRSRPQVIENGALIVVLESLSIRRIEQWNLDSFLSSKLRAVGVR
jgi:hypothetical protein